MTATEKTIKLLKYFQIRQGIAIDSYDKELQSELEVKQRQLSRELKSISNHFDQIVEITNGRKKAYKLINQVDILQEGFSSDVEIGMLFEMARDGMSADLFESWDTSSELNNKPYKFFNMPLEDTLQLEKDENFINLKMAIERREYRDIKLKGGKAFKDTKPLKLLFSDGNWYIAYVDCKKFRFSRISFVEKVSYSKKSECYQKNSIDPYLKWLSNSFQNTFSLYGVNPIEARLYAKPKIARYFEKEFDSHFR